MGGGEGMGLYRCVMVVVLIYGYNRQRDGQRDRHKIEIGRYGCREQRAETERYIPDAYCLALSACRFTLVQIFALHKKIF